MLMLNETVRWKLEREISGERSCGTGEGTSISSNEDSQQHIKRLKNSMLADEADNPGFLLLLEQAEREMKAGRPQIATTYLDKYLEDKSTV